MNAVMPQPFGPQQFASDNYAGICPEAWAAMAEANQGYVPVCGRPFGYKGVLERFLRAGSGASVCPAC